MFSEFETALYNILIDDVVLSTILKGNKIYSVAVPEDSPYPYIVFGFNTSINLETFNKTRNSNILAINIYSEYVSKSEVFTIYERLVEILHRRRISLSTGNHISGSIRLSQILPQQDQKGIFGVAHYDVRVEQ